MTIVNYLLLFFFTPFYLYSQADELLWIKQFETIEGCGVEEVLMEDSLIFIALQFQGNLEIDDTILRSEGLFDLALLCYDLDANLKWVLQAGSNNTDNTTGLELSEDGRIFWTGLFWDELRLGEETYNVTVRSRAIFVASVNKGTGDVVWCNLLQGEGIKESNTIASDSAGTLLLGGFFNISLFVDSIMIQSESVNAGYFVVFNQQGRLIQHFVTEGTGSAKILASKINKDRIYISGTYSSSVIMGGESLSGPLLDTDIFLASFDRAGELLWLSTATGLLEDIVVELQFADENRILMAGNFAGRLLFGPGLELQSKGFASDIFAAFYDLDGNAQSIFSISNPGNDVLMSLRKSGFGWILSGTFDQEFLWDEQLFEAPSSGRSGFVLHLNHELEVTLAIDVALSEGFLGKSSADSAGEITAFGFSIPAFTSFVGQEFLADGIYKGFLVVYKSLSSSSSHEGQNISDFKVYPNPAGKCIVVQSPYMNQVILSTLTGMVVGSWRHADIELPQLPNGHYLLTVVMKNGSKQSSLIQIIN